MFYILHYSYILKILRSLIKKFKNENILIKKKTDKWQLSKNNHIAYSIITKFLVKVSNIKNL